MSGDRRHTVVVLADLGCRDVAVLVGAVGLEVVPCLVRLGQVPAGTRNDGCWMLNVSLIVFTTTVAMAHGTAGRDV